MWYTIVLSLYINHVFYIFLYILYHTNIHSDLLIMFSAAYHTFIYKLFIL